MRGLRFIRDGNGLEPFEARFHEAALVLAATLLAVRIAPIVWFRRPFVYGAKTRSNTIIACLLPI